MRQLLTIGICLLVVWAYAQKKPKINQAMKALDNKEYAEAKSIIDAAIEHEKTKDDPKTWYYRGQIYAQLDTVLNIEGALQESVKAFKKTIELDPKQSKVTEIGAVGVKNVDTNLQDYFLYYYNQGGEKWEAQEYGDAVELFSTAHLIREDADTTAILYAAYSAQNNDDEEKAIELYKETINSGATGKSIHYNLIAMLTNRKDNEAALEAIAKAKEIYPGDTRLNRQEISILIEEGRQQEAKDQLLSAVEDEPDDPALKFTLGILYEELDEPEKAKEAYRSAMKVDPDHFESNFNLAVLIFSEANDLYKEKNALGISREDQRKEREMEPKIKAGFTKALPMWEKVHSIKPEDKSAMETLAFLYSYLDMKDKAEAMQNKLGTE